MKEERMKILEMVESEKITAQEAIELLAAIGAKQTAANNFEENASDFARNVQDFAKELSTRTGEAYKSIQPKLKEATRKVVSKTAEVVDNLSKSLNDAIKNMDSSECCCTEDCEDECTQNNQDTENREN